MSSAKQASKATISLELWVADGSELSEMENREINYSEMEVYEASEYEYVLLPPA